MNYTLTPNCRICGTETRQIADLGTPALSSMFPRPGEEAPRIPVTVRECPSCGLIQLGESTNPALMYRDGYGYKSGINESMVAHLRDIVTRGSLFLKGNDSVLDIGCNDGTLLKLWESYGVNRFGYDPIGEDVPGATIVRDYFKPHDRKYRVITSIAMLYDLPDPVAFAKAIYDCLEDDGAWILEVGYAGAIQDGCWDGICHEHLTYFGLKQITAIADRTGFNVSNATLNSVNGGSLQCVLKKRLFPSGVGASSLSHENLWDWRGLQLSIAGSCKVIRDEVAFYGHSGTYVLGASTKGNMLLQTCGLDHNFIEAAIERNPDKVGRMTPGSNILIRSEGWMHDHPPKVLLVLPYHFREALLHRYADLREAGVKFIFPLPTLEVV